MRELQQNVCSEVQLDFAVHRDVCGAESAGSFVESDCGETGLYDESAVGSVPDRTRAGVASFPVSAAASAEVKNHAAGGSGRRKNWVSSLFSLALFHATCLLDDRVHAYDCCQKMLSQISLL